jgi:hypothetical protein
VTNLNNKLTNLLEVGLIFNKLTNILKSILKKITVIILNESSY